MLGSWILSSLIELEGDLMLDGSQALPAITVSRDVLFKKEGAELFVFWLSILPLACSGMSQSVKSAGLSFSHLASNILFARE